MSCFCLCSVALPHSGMGLQCVIVVFPDHIHLPFVLCEKEKETGTNQCMPFCSLLS